MKGGGVGGRVLEAKEVLEFAGGEEIFGLAGLAAIFDRRRDRALAAPIDADRALIRIGAEVFRSDVEDGGVVKPVLGRQCAGDERHLADEARLQKLAEPGDTIRQDNAVDAKLHVRVLVAHVIVAGRCRILGDAGKLGHQNVADRLVGPPGRVADLLVSDLRYGRSRLRQDVFARLIRPFDLLREDAVGGRLLLSGRLRGGCGGASGRRWRSARRGGGRGAPGRSPWGFLGGRHRDLRQVRLRPGGLRRGRLRCSRRAARRRLRCARWRRGRLLSDRSVAYRDEGYCRSAKKQTRTNGNCA